MTPPSISTIAVIVGMRTEAALLPPGLAVRCSGGIPDKARRLAEELLEEGAAGLVSFGIAGGLAPHLRPGALVIGGGVATKGQVIETDPAWQRALLSLLPGSIGGLVEGETEAAASAETKRRLHEAHGALAVDLESAAVATVCRAAQAPFAVIRAIADPAERSLPSLALDALDPDGLALPMKVAAGLLRRPWELPGLIQVGLDSRTALSTLRGAVGRLGPALGFQPA